MLNIKAKKRYKQEPSDTVLSKWETPYKKGFESNCIYWEEWYVFRHNNIVVWRNKMLCFSSLPVVFLRKKKVIKSNYIIIDCHMYRNMWNVLHWKVTIIFGWLLVWDTTEGWLNYLKWCSDIFCHPEGLSALLHTHICTYSSLPVSKFLENFKGPIILTLPLQLKGPFCDVWAPCLYFQVRGEHCRHSYVDWRQRRTCWELPTCSFSRRCAKSCPLVTSCLPLVLRPKLLLHIGKLKLNNLSKNI